MFIDKFDSENKQLTDDEKSIEGVTRSIVKPFSRESAISSEATQRSIDEQPIGITVNELEGKFSNIPANSTVKIRMEYQHETNDSESILLVFRSDLIRNAENEVKTHYITKIKKINIFDNIK